MRIDLSADVGESSDPELPAALLRSVTSVNIVCGVHAGTPSLIRQLLAAARDAGVRAGAHPSLPDREGGGRRTLPVTAADVEDAVLYQLAALSGMATAEGVRLAHVKPHGALYHMAARDDSIATAVVKATRFLDSRLVIVGLPDSRLLEVARAAGLTVRAEAFADRAYERDGSLVPRDRTGAVIQDRQAVVARSLRLVRERRVLAADGVTDLQIHAETLCIHGDTPGAGEIALAVRDALQRAGVTVAAA